MDLEQLKMIIDFLNNTGENVEPLVITYMLINPIVSIIITVFVTTLIYKIFKHIVYSVNSNERLEYIRDLMKVGTPGYVTEGEFKKMISFVKHHTENNGGN